MADALGMTLELALIICGVGRIVLGVAPFVAVGFSIKLLGFPVEHDNQTARLMARLFGVRDAGLGVLALYAIDHPELLVPIILFNAAMDGGDLLSASIPLVRRAGIDRGAATTAAFADLGGSCWLAIWALWG